jgi:hypothetical protein
MDFLSSGYEQCSIYIMCINSTRFDSFLCLFPIQVNYFKFSFDHYNLSVKVRVYDSGRRVARKILIVTVE